MQALFKSLKTTVPCLLVFLLLSGCLARPLVKKTDDARHRAQNKIIERQVIQKARTGDWLVTRGYHATDNLVANATGIPISHVAVFNAEKRQVIEAKGTGVQLTGLPGFVDKSYRLLIIRPRWQNDKNGPLAWKKALKLVGRDYDFLGTIGFNYPKRFYCSELAVSIYKPWFNGKEKFPKVIKPGEMYLYGRVLYDSLPRDEGTSVFSSSTFNYALNSKGY